MVHIYEAPYAGWERCLFIENDAVQLAATLEVGPRIIRYAAKNGANMFYEFPAHIGRTGDSEWLNYGGHRLWTAPEERPRSYPADNFPVDFTVDGNTVTLTPPPETAAGIQKQILVTLDDVTSAVTVEHRVTNTGLWPIELAAWGITVTDQGGLEVIPEPNDPNALLPNRKVALWPYSKMNDPRVYWGDRYITIRQDNTVDPPFKLGVDGRDGVVAVFNHGQVFIKRFDVEPNATYPDYGVAFESYVCGEMLECETLSPLNTVNAGETVIWTERWELHESASPAPDDEAEIDRLLKPYR